MAVVKTFPVTTLNPAHGPYTFGPYSVKAQDTTINLSIDRTQAGGLTATPSAHLHIEIQQSSDGGTTWVLLVGCDVLGGDTSFTDIHGVFHDGSATEITAGVDRSQGKTLQGVVTALNVSVTVAGSLAIT